ncbi:hypothetical protein A2U01_0095167, partial [Trifolium medium]|nr:hypothetical protein [Trifolium medium]
MLAPPIRSRCSFLCSFGQVNNGSYGQVHA